MNITPRLFEGDGESRQIAVAIHQRAVDSHQFSAARVFA